MVTYASLVLEAVGIFLLIQSITCNHMASYEDVKVLKHELFVAREYNKMTRPILDQSRGIGLDVGVHIASIDVESVDETVMVSAYIGLRYTDEMLSWNDSEYAEQSAIFTTQGAVWTPELSVTNTAEESRPFGYKDLPVLVEFNGYSEHWSFNIMRLTCKIDVYYYPFDEHECVIQFTVLGYRKYEVYFQDYFQTSLFYTPNSEWEQSIDRPMQTIGNLDEPPKLEYYFRLKRRPSFVMVSIIIPSILLAVLNVFVFMLPNGSGEKASYAITVFLSFAILTTGILATFPRNAIVIAVFAWYILLQTVQSTIITILALVFVRLSSFDDTETPVYHFLLNFIRIIRCKNCRIRCPQNNEVIAIDSDQNDTMEVQTDTKSVAEDDVKIQNTINANYTWNEVLTSLDLFCFILFSMLLFISTASFFVITVYKY